MSIHEDHDNLMWVYPTLDPEWLNKIIHEFKIHPVIAQILVSRGFRDLEEIHNYLYAKLPNLINPNLFLGMDKAVARIAKALREKEEILICGDNDVDGITATTLLIEFLDSLGLKSHYFITGNVMIQSSLLDAVEYANQKQCSLIITVDCGTTAVEEALEAKKRHIDMIVADHHEPVGELPDCIAVLNPKVGQGNYPNRELTGVGVAFKLVHAVANYFISHKILNASDIDLKKYLDLVALGTVADMGALLGENRILVRYGLYQLRKGQRVGLSKLIKTCELDQDNITAGDIASKIAPRLNSLGRIDDPEKGVDLLLTHDSSKAERLAKELDQNNSERQKIERHDFEDIENYISKNPAILNEKSLVFYSDKWHPGIIPIITARLNKLYNRPCLVIAIENGIGKGSIRTIPEFPLLPILKKNADLLLSFGGHDFAAGFTIKEANIPAFKQNFIKEANENLKEQDVISKLYLDSKVEFKELSFDLLESINLLEPFGNENPTPVLYTTAKQTWTSKIVGKIHLKIYLEEGNRVLEGIAFGMAHRYNQIRKKNAPLLIAFTPQLNTFLNKTSIQLQIRDFQVSS